MGIEQKKIAHAQMFSGAEANGALCLALAYAKEIIYSGATSKEAQEKAKIKCDRLTHPDLHFVFPKINQAASEAKSKDQSWEEMQRTFLLDNPFGSLFDWYNAIGVENKQGSIGVEEVTELVRKVYLKPYESLYKVFVIWMPEKLNGVAANKILKALEEPPPNTVFLFVAERSELVLSTILSRCQEIRLGPLTSSDIEAYLQKRGADPQVAQKIARTSRESLKRALDLLQGNSENMLFEQWFVVLVRMAFSAKGNKGAVLKLTEWSRELSKSGRETQKEFLKFSLEIFRQAFMKNYGLDSLAFIEALDDNFDMNRFAPFVHSGNIFPIADLFEKAIYHIERNGNPQLIFTDLAIRLTRHLHTKETEDFYKKAR